MPGYRQKYIALDIEAEPIQQNPTDDYSLVAAVQKIGTTGIVTMRAFGRQERCGKIWNNVKLALFVMVANLQPLIQLFKSEMVPTCAFVFKTSSG